ncbi:MAG: hypothetical protein EXQ67_09335 [Thermoleophilia bacterium]|nr:hypothetical protein [Thermoleophilia bacterium]
MTEALVCPQCGTTGRAGAAFCGACGSALPKPEDARSGTVIAPTPDFVKLPAVPAAVATPPPVATAEPASVANPIGGELTVFPWWQVIIFSIISYGVWTLYWFYCTRKQVSGLVETNRDDPGTQTFGYLVPIWQVWVVRDMWRDIDGVAQKAGTVGINAKSYTIWFAVCSYVPLINYAGVIVVPIFYLITQSRLMAALKALNGGVTTNRRVTPWSGVWAFGPIVLGVIFAILASL